MTTERHLDWAGCFNVRDLGGLRTAAGGEIRRGAIVRADSPNRLTRAGWSAVEAHGVRTIVDLRNDVELGADAAPRPTGLTTVHVPIDDAADTAFWEHCWKNGLDGTPLYYQLFLDRKAERCAAAVTAVARAQRGGVVIHCGLGRDRTGLVAVLLLALAGVRADEIVSDYALSNPRLPPLFALLGVPEALSEVEACLARKDTTAAATLLQLLTALDVNAYLSSAGVTEEDLAAVRARMG